MSSDPALAAAEVEEITHEGVVLAIVIRNRFDTDGVAFVTPGSFSQQLAYMHHPVGKQIDPHFHNPLVREVEFTQEVLVIKSGKVRVDFYNDAQAYLFSTVLVSGDTILLAHGGHGFEILEETRMIEVKQGPYAGDKDKIRFDSIPSDKTKLQG